MGVRDNVLAQARNDIGVAENPPHSNHSEITDWYNKNVENLGYSWAGCEAGVTKWMWTGGAKSLKVGRAYTVWGANDYVKGTNGGRWFWGTTGIQPGDQVYFDWGGKKGTTAYIDHTGIVEYVQGGYIYTIENNTRYDDCRRMKRDATYVVGFGRPDYARLDAATNPDTPNPKPVQIVTGKPNPKKVRDFQRLLETGQDGDWGKNTDSIAAVMRVAALRGRFDVKRVQAVINTKVDGAWGPNSRAALAAWVKKVQALLGVKADGAWGPITDTAYLKFRKENFMKF